MNYRYYLLIISMFGIRTATAQFHGQIRDAATQETLPGVAVRSQANPRQGVLSNKYGFFSLPVELPDTILISAVGYQPLVLPLSRSVSLDFRKIDLVAVPKTLDELTVTANKPALLNDAALGKLEFTGEQIKKLNLPLGEKDPLKAFQLLPGIQPVREGSSSLSFRGGDADQNLLILDEATVYNANHLFGFFSTFNADPIQHISVYKSYFPAQYGGRLSSIVDFKMREGNKKRFGAEGGIGLLSSRLLVEGPLARERASFLVAARRTYADWLLRPFQPVQEKTGYYFGDINLKLNVDINAKNALFWSTYWGKDAFEQRTKIPRQGDFLLANARLNWGNTTSLLRWNRVLSEKAFMNTSAIFSRYDMELGDDLFLNYRKPPQYTQLALRSGVQDVSLKTDVDWYLQPQTTLRLGGVVTRHQFRPRAVTYASNAGTSDNLADTSQTFTPTEAAVYAQWQADRRRLFYQAGLRLAYFSTQPRVYAEPRVQVGYKLLPQLSVAGAYTRMNQFLHLFSNTGNGLPTDLWVPAVGALQPSRADMLNASLTYKPRRGPTLLLESYYKWITGNSALKSGGSIVETLQGGGLKPFRWEELLQQGRSWNYGHELTLQGQWGKLNYLGGYALAWSVAQFPNLNNGLPFYTTQDRRHTLKLSAAYALTPRWTFTGNLAYSTGNYLSVPNAFFFREDRYTNYLEMYNGVNTFKARDYFRVDVGVQYQTRRGSWEFALYNASNRKNPYNYGTSLQRDPTTGTSKVVLKQQWLLPILPTINYNFKL